MREENNLEPLKTFLAAFWIDLYIPFRMFLETFPISHPASSKLAERQVRSWAGCL